MFELADIRERLSSHKPTFIVPGEATRQAAVAIVLREHQGHPQALFIQRAIKAGDPWSGHMAFPGGHRDPDDAGLKEAAMRETLEETGLDLGSARWLGALNHERAQPRGRVLDMLIAPHIFEIDGDPRFTPNHEVADVVWAPLSRMARNELHDTEKRPVLGNMTVFNGYRLAGGHFVWGLTYRILKSFFTTLDPTWVGPPEI
ncbi:MAG: CoA pyrophosphatase [Gammaproteobacteria bacterium]|nr:CoA pyrophosphatase [Gammaproteobacteria bacterium]